jgi:antitoxin component YwqK of YwqJK toxin-antitoxin module
MTWDEKIRQIENLAFTNHGVLDGPTLAWHSNGQLWMTYNYIKGNAEGPLTVWYPNGEISVRAFLRGGEPDGPWEKYDESGHLRFVTRYANGKIVRD